MTKKETDYKKIYHDYYNRGYSKDWLKGCAHRLWANKLITRKRYLQLLNFVEKLK